MEINKARVFTLLLLEFALDLLAGAFWEQLRKECEIASVL
jgi:hypothetical protein